MSDAPRPNRLRAVARGMPSALLGVALGALILHLTIRDRVLYLSTIFYAMPYPVIAALAAPSLILSLRRGRRRLAWAALLPMLAALAGFVAGSFHWNSRPAAEPQIRVVFWNCFKGRLGFEAAAEKLRGLDADVIALTEAGHDTKEVEAFWKSSFPGYAASELEHGCLILARGAIHSHREKKPGPGGRMKIFEIGSGGAEFTLVHLDMKSDPLRSRRDALEGLHKRLKKLRSKPLILVGDFNTPIDSAFLDPLRENYRNAFEAAGRGLYVTWPMPFPILALDQIWLSPEWEPTRCEIGATIRSDHRPIWVDLRLSNEKRLSLQPSRDKASTSPRRIWPN